MTRSTDFHIIRPPIAVSLLSPLFRLIFDISICESDLINHFQLGYAICRFDGNRLVCTTVKDGSVFNRLFVSLSPDTIPKVSYLTPPFSRGKFLAIGILSGDLFRAFRLRAFGFNISSIVTPLAGSMAFPS